jgi:hypothetical protein
LGVGQIGKQRRLGDIDTKMIQAVMQIIYDDVIPIPYIEESRFTFFQKGVHDPSAYTYTLNDNFNKEVWMDPSAR